MYSWGWNKFGQLGLGHNEDVNHPIRMATIPAADRYALVPTVPLGAGDGDGDAAVPEGQEMKRARN